MKNLIFWGAVGCAIHYYNVQHSHNADIEANSRTQAAQAIVQSDDSRQEREYRNEICQQRLAAYQAHIDSQRIQISIDNAASEARDAAFDARMAADRAEFSR